MLALIVPTNTSLFFVVDFQLLVPQWWTVMHLKKKNSLLNISVGSRFTKVSQFKTWVSSLLKHTHI